MADPTNELSWGWIGALLTFAGLAGAAMREPIALATHWIRGAREEEEKKEQKIEDRFTAMGRELEADLSEVRQHVAEVHKALSGDITMLQGRLADIYKEMIERDERFLKQSQETVSTTIRDHETRMSRQMEQMSKFLAGLIQSRRRPPPDAAD